MSNESFDTEFMEFVFPDAEKRAASKTSVTSFDFTNIQPQANGQPIEPPRFIDLTAPVEYVTLTGDMIPQGVKQNLSFLFNPALPDEDESDAIENYRFGLKNCWVGGGALLSALIGNPINDYDLFSADPDALVKQIEEKQITHSKWENSRVTNFRLYNHGDRLLQVIKAFKYQSPEATLNDFDFTIVGAAYDGEKVICHPRWLLDAAQKRLVIHRLVRPLNTLNRLLKYSTRGFSTCPVSHATIVKHVTEMTINWDDPDQNDLQYYTDGSIKYPGID